MNVGIFLADFAYGILNHFFSTAYAWRIGFIIGGVLAILSYFLRKALRESPAFMQEETRYQTPFFALFHQHKLMMLRGFFIVSCQATLITMLYLFLVSFMTLHHYSTDRTAWLTGVNLALFSVMCLVWGWASDYIGQRLTMTLGIIITAPLAVWLYACISAHETTYIVYGLLAISSAMFTGSFSAFLARLFPVSMRYSGVAICYNLGFAIFAGLTPMLATYLVHVSGSDLMPSYIFIFGGILGLIGIWADKV